MGSRKSWIYVILAQQLLKPIVGIVDTQTYPLLNLEEKPNTSQQEKTISKELVPKFKDASKPSHHEYDPFISAQNSPQNLVYVGLLDGRIVALNQYTGEQVWQYSTGDPLSKSTLGYLPTEKGGSSRGRVLVAAADGYIYSAEDSETRRLMYLPALVNSGDQIASRSNIIFQGSKSSVIYKIDAMSGRPIYVADLSQFASSQKPQIRTQASDVSEMREDESVYQLYEDDFVVDDQLIIDSDYDSNIYNYDSSEDQALLFVRENYFVRGLDPKNGKELWNASYSKIRSLMDTESSGMDDLDFTLGGVATHIGNPLSKSNEYIPLNLHVDQGNLRLHGFHAETQEKWVHEFDRQIVSAFVQPQSEATENTDGSPSLYFPPRNDKPVNPTFTVNNMLMFMVNEEDETVTAFPFHVQPGEELITTNVKMLPSGEEKYDPGALPIIQISEPNYQDIDLYDPLAQFGVNLQNQCPIDESQLQDNLKLDEGKGLGDVGLVRRFMFTLQGGLFGFLTTLAVLIIGFGVIAYQLGARSNNGQISALGVNIRQRVVKDGVTFVGRLQISSDILGYGSAGTIVFDGSLDGRPVAVKRMVRHFHEIAQKELEHLVTADEHPNVLRCYAMEEDGEFIYLALEKCHRTLHEVILQTESDENQNEDVELYKNEDLNQSEETVGQSVQNIQGSSTQFMPLTEAQLWQIARQMAEGVAALHERGIVHRDIKPQNVLLNEVGSAKISDMGIARQINLEQTSFTVTQLGGTAGWKAPEQLYEAKQSRRSNGRAFRNQQLIKMKESKAVDVFSLGCVLYFCFTGGSHPFGDSGSERDVNVRSGTGKDLKGVNNSPELKDLLSSMITYKPELRPRMGTVLAHPAWWSNQQQLTFLIRVSDRMEHEDRFKESKLLEAFEALTQVAVSGEEWGGKLDNDLKMNLGRYRQYDFESLRDLMRVIRNKHNHYREMPPELQELMGEIPEGYLKYFTSKYPRLLLTTFQFVCEHLKDDPMFGDWISKPIQEYWPTRKQILLKNPQEVKEGYQMVSSKPKKKQCPKVQKSNNNASPKVDTQLQQLGIIGLIPDEHNQDGFYGVNPLRPGQPSCDFYQKTGHCAFGNDCMYDHPQKYRIKRNLLGYPMRPGEKVCEYFLQHAKCKYGAGCCNHHPNLTLEINSELNGGQSRNLSKQQQLQQIQKQFEEKYYQSQSSQVTLPKNPERNGETGGKASSSNWWRRTENEFSQASATPNVDSQFRRRGQGQENGRTESNQSRW